jgi:hypothetical protein
VSGSTRHQAKEIFVCPLCQVENRATAKFCRRCGKTRAELDIITKSNDSTSAVTPSEIDVPAQPQEPVPADQEAAAAPLAFVYAGPETPIQAQTADQRSPDMGASSEPAAQPSGSEADVLTSPADVLTSEANVLTSEADVQAFDADVSTSDDAAPNNFGRQTYVYDSPECPSCHSGLRVTDKFCSWCGESQPNRLYPDLRVCPGCDQRLPYRANYCFSCGRDVGVHPRIEMRMPTELFKEEDSEFFPTFEA